jgi:hypothetical protein
MPIQKAHFSNELWKSVLSDVNAAGLARIKNGWAVSRAGFRGMDLRSSNPCTKITYLEAIIYEPKHAPSTKIVQSRQRICVMC